MSRSFVHLHNHSEYSLLDGSCRLSELVETAREFGQPAVAITDHGNLFAALKFYRQAKAAGVKPIIGVEAYMAVGSRLTRGGGPGAGRRKPYHHMILLARDYTGYRNLLKLVSRGYTEGFYYKPRIDREILAEHAEGLIGTSGCLGGEIPQLLLAGRKEEAESTIRAYQEILGVENFFLELQDQGIPEEHAILPDLRTLSRRTGAPLLATNDCHYMRAADHFAHDVLICIQTGKTIDDPRTLRFTDQHYFKNTDEMWERFRDIPEALENTLLVAERCNLDIPDRGYQLPHFQVPGDVSSEDYFRRVVQEGYEARGPRWARWRAAGELKHSEEEYRERLQREMDTIIQMGFPGYFLIVWDLIRHARQEGIPVGPGRGSAAGSLVAYCLAITDLDPLRYDLLFERFLNPERVSMPDIDIDFCVKGRGRVIDYVTEKYGRENVAQIITFGTMAARAVIRDVGRGLNIPFAKVDRIAKLVPAELDATIDSSLKSVPELQEACGDPDVKRLLEVARRLEGLARHASTHAAGVVIAPAPITDFAPLYQVKEGERTTQFSMGDLESIGLLKMDFLGLKTLTLIDDVVKRVSARLGQEIDFDSIGIDDPQTYELFARGATSGLFQFESDGMKDILRKLKPERFEDLIALNALYRPGPLKGGLVDDFIKRRHGQIQVEYIVPELRPILEETYGVMVYQEQVMKIASELGGFSLGDADLLRRAMGKKNVDLLAAQKKTFLQGTRERGIDPHKGEKIFAQMEHFAGYGFNKSHSAAYALVAYQTGYLKAHFPLDFMASLLTAERNNTDKLVSYLAECRDMGLEILPPDIALSHADFSAEENSIRFGLSAIKNAGEGAVEAVLAARQRLGTIHSLQELVMEVEQRAVNRRVFEAFIKSGCLDSIYPVRARLMAGLDRIQDMAHKARQDQESGQGSLFVAGEGDERPSLDDGLPEVEPWSDHETLAYEKESLGFYLSGHPLGEYAREVADFGTHNSADMRHVRSGEAVVIAGMISAIRKRKTRKGDWMAVLTLEDLEGICEVVLFPDLTASSNEILVEDAAILVTGRAESQGGDERGKILAEEILPLSQVRHKRARAVAISLEAPGLDESRLLSLRRVLECHKGGVPVVFVLTQPSSFRAEVKPSPELRVSPGDGLTEAVEAVLGPGALKLRIRA